MTTILQLSPSLPVTCPKGSGLAWFLIDYGEEHHLMWVVAIDETGEIWTFSNPEVRAQKNVTMGRTLQKDEMLLCLECCRFHRNIGKYCTEYCREKAEKRSKM